MYAAGPNTPLGRYRLIALLGQGGMADVFLACTQGPGGFQKLLVVKVARFTGDPVLATMFLDEARIAAQLEHPNVVQTYEIAENGSRQYIVMEYLDGGNLAHLRQRSRKTGGISLRISLTILSHVLEGLEYAHEARALDGRELGVVHRDLSPANIMVTAQGVVKIVDFGIAKATDSYSFMQTGKFCGTFGYMPPEQSRGEPVDVRADLFAFGAILAEAALNGRLWGTATEREIASRLVNNQIPTLGRGKPIDPDLRAICERALAPQRDRRYATAGELKADLARYLAAHGGPVSQRELAQFVRTTVAEDRAQLQAVIDTQLQKLGSQSWDGIPTLELPRITHTPPYLQPQHAANDNQIVVEDRRQPQVTTADPAPVAATMPSRRLSLRFFAFCGTLLLATIVLVALRLRPSEPSTSTRAPVQPATITPLRAATSDLEIVASPADTPRGLDGEPLGADPHGGELPRNRQSYELYITAPGSPALTHRLALDLGRDPGRDAVPSPPAPPHHGAARPLLQTRPMWIAAPPKVLANVEPAPTATSSKPGIDTDVYIAPSNKRALDSNVLDDHTSKPTIERNPWGK
jgi:serine/threonine protein kinase